MLAFYLLVFYSLNNLASAQNVPNGIMEASNAKKLFLKVQFCVNVSQITPPTYKINKTPCNIPKTLFGCGIAKTYFNGIVIKSITKNETPSIKAKIRNIPNCVVIVFSF